MSLAMALAMTGPDDPPFSKLRSGQPRRMAEEDEDEEVYQQPDRAAHRRGKRDVPQSVGKSEEWKHPYGAEFDAERGFVNDRGVNRA